MYSMTVQLRTSIQYIVCLRVYKYILRIYVVSTEYTRTVVYNLLHTIDITRTLTLLHTRGVNRAGPNAGRAGPGLT